MVLFTGLLITLIAVVLLLTISVLVSGAGLIVLFSDVIVCVGIIVWIVKRLSKKRRRD